MIASAALAGAAGISAAPLDLPGALERLSHPSRLLGMALFILIIGPLPEEIGWRGYLLDRLQLRWNALVASLVLGVVWWSWHLPLFMLPGYFDAFGQLKPTPLEFLFGILPAAILYTWVYNNTGRSVLAVILLHFMQNFSSELLGIAPEARPILLALTTVLAIGVVAWWGPRTLRRGKPVPVPMVAGDEVPRGGGT